MTWAEIKRAAEESGIKDSDEINAIICEAGEGAKKFHKVKLGNSLKLTEKRAEDSRDYSGCGV